MKHDLRMHVVIMFSLYIAAWNERMNYGEDTLADENYSEGEEGEEYSEEEGEETENTEEDLESFNESIHYNYTGDFHTKFYFHNFLFSFSI